MTKHSVPLETAPETPSFAAPAPKRARSKRPLRVAAGLLALAAAFIGWDDRSTGRFGISTADASVQADGTPATAGGDGMAYLDPPQSITEAGKATIAVSFRPSMIRL